MLSTLLTTAYWPNLQYFYYVLNSENIFIELHEHYQKQSFRNRTRILTSNGVLDLTIPVHAPNKTTINRVEISYRENWQVNHWRAITSAYKNSPYFEFFEDEIKQLYSNTHQYLLEYNTDQLKIIFKILRLKKQVHFTSEFNSQLIDSNDLREEIHPKRSFMHDPRSATILVKPYYQTFSEKFPFQANLSILDLLFNKGLETIAYLKTRENSYKV